MATVVFSDLSGYTAMNEALDPEEVIEAMEEIRAEAERLAEEHGGILNQVVGDEVVMLFGVPTAHDDDPLRAVQAALALHERVAELGAEMEQELGRPLRMHTGVHTGLLLVTEGDGRGGVYAITGDTVNTCARIRSAAADDEVMVGPATLRAIAPFFETEATEPLPLKGKAEPLVVHRIVGATGHRTRFDVARARGLMPQVGRELELGLLQEDLERAGEGHLRSTVLVGEAGVGKSRLLHELCAHAEEQGVRLLLGRCDSYGQVAPYQPFVGLLRELFGLDAQAGPRDDGPESIEEAVAHVVAHVGSRWPALREQVPYLLRLLALESPRHPVPPGVAGVALQELMLDALCALFRTMAQERPLLLVVEDWHWADAASDLAMQRVLSSVGGRAMVVLTARPSRLPPWLDQLTRIMPLAALDGAQTAQLARDVLQVEYLSDSLSRFLFERTAGNPLFVEEFCRALSEEGLIEIDFGSARLSTGAHADELPFTVQSVVRSRVDRLPDGGRDLLSLCAVVGAKVPVRYLEALDHASDTLQARLDGLERAQLLRRGDSPSTYQFSHAVIQEVAYDAMLKKERRELHGQVAELIEQTYRGERLAAEYESLAHHYGAAGQALEACRYAELAGDKATAGNALEQASAQYREALAHLAAAPRQQSLVGRHIDLSLKWGQVAIWKPDPRMLAVLEQALSSCEQLGDGRGAAQALYWLGWHLYTLGDHERAMEYFRSCAQRAGSAGRQRLAAQAHANLAYCQVAGRAHDAALSSLQQARELLPEGDGPRAWGDMLMDGYEAMIHADRGEFDRAHRLLHQALSVARQHRNPPAEGSALAQQGMIQCQQGAFAQARETGAALLSLAERIQAPYLRAMGLTVLGQVQTFLDDDPDGALRALDEAVEELEELGLQLTMSWNRGCQAEGLLLAGRLERAQRSAQRALARAKAGDRRGEVMALRVLAMVHASQAQPDAGAALEGLNRAHALSVQSALPRESALCDYWQAEALQRLGQPQQARDAARRARETLRALGMGFYAERAGALAD